MNLVQMSTDLVRSDPSISESLEDIQQQILDKYDYYTDMVVKNPAEDRSMLIPFAPAYRVYFLFNAGELVYIGQTTQLPGRITSHLNDGKLFDEVASIELECQEDLLIVEGLNIIEHKPKLNQSIPTTSELLKMTLKSIVWT